MRPPISQLSGAVFLGSAAPILTQFGQSGLRPEKQRYRPGRFWAGISVGRARHHSTEADASPRLNQMCRDAPFTPITGR